ncbi:hypothetical protein B0H10DRAFT_1636858, partial [Mycena sp. CBHHK59/15]
DKKTTFWNKYKILAEEFDNEFQKRYGNDLDTALIFAGLFSAVSSAFIIQIQPELQQDPSDVTQALIQVLIHSVNQTAFPAAQVPKWSGPPTKILAAQTLLYISLFATLLAALLAVLGKQW